MDKTEPKEENIIKKTCKELGFTYKELGEKIGYSESAIKMTVSNKRVSEPMNKAIDLYMENKKLKQEIEKSAVIKNTLKEWLH